MKLTYGTWLKLSAFEKEHTQLGVKKLKLKLLIGIGLSILIFLLVKKFEVGARSEGRTFSLPSTASRVSEDVYYLGKARDIDGREVEGYAFVRRQGNAKPVKPPKGGGPSCYGFLANGAKWKSLEPWVVNPNNLSGLSGSFVINNLSDDIAKWESAAGKDILGNGFSTNDNLVADTVSPDNLNEVYFADVTDGGAIAVTIVWGYFGGPPQTRQLVEWDQVYDDVDYPWSSSGEAQKMDFENTATHELGHSVGMDDIYESGCSEVTMYGYADYGETKKSTLETPDIAGVQKLYK